MAKPLGLASEAELSTSPCERHRDVNDCVLVEVSLAHAKVFQELVCRLVQRASRGDHDGNDRMCEVKFGVVSVGLVDGVLQHFGDGVPSASKVLGVLVRLGGVEGQRVLVRVLRDLFRVGGYHGAYLDVDVWVRGVQGIAVGHVDF